MEETLKLDSVEDAATESDDAPSVTQPTKLIRMASMIRAMPKLCIKH